MNNIPTPRQYAERHAKAFRTAFDFLNRHFPPEMSDEYWQAALKDMKSVWERADGDPLATSLLVDIWEYLDEEARIRNGVDEHEYQCAGK